MTLQNATFDVHHSKGWWMSAPGTAASQRSAIIAPCHPRAASRVCPANGELPRRSRRRRRPSLQGGKGVPDCARAGAYMNITGDWPAAGRALRLPAGTGMTTVHAMSWDGSMRAVA